VSVGAGTVPLLLHAILFETTGSIVVGALVLWALASAFAMIGLRIRRARGAPMLFLATIGGWMLVTIVLGLAGETELGAIAVIMAIAGLAQAAAITVRTRRGDSGRTMSDAAIGGGAFVVAFAAALAGAVRIGAIQ
jgi:hypothetical protein